MKKEEEMGKREHQKKRKKSKEKKKVNMAVGRSPGAIQANTQ